MTRCVGLLATGVFLTSLADDAALAQTTPPAAEFSTVNGNVDKNAGRDKNSGAKSKRAKSGPSISWVNPPTDKHLPLTPGATHKTFKSKLAGQDVGFVIYLPPQYETNRQMRFPVIYNLHGNGGNELTSTNVVEVLHEQISSGQIPPLIMVLANGGHSTFYKDSFDGKFPIESILITELIPHIDQHYRTIASGDARCIEGFSMGGRGAARLAVKYPEMFCSLFCQAGNVPRLLDTFDQMTQQEREKHLLGPNRSKWEKDDVYAVTEFNRAKIRKHLRIQIACGTKDGGHLPTVRDWHDHLVDQGIDHTYLELQGLAHNRNEMIEQLKPIWFDGHVTALRNAGAFDQESKIQAAAKQSPDSSLPDSSSPEHVELISDIRYVVTPQGPQSLDLYRPQTITGKLPVIVFVHGGGWKGGDKKSAIKNAVWLVPEGYAVASINYRLTDVSAWPTQIDDCYAAVRWVRDNSDKYQLDGDRIVSWGTSAGGHLSALMGTRPFPNAESTSSRVQASIDWFGPADLLTMPPNMVTDSQSFEKVSQSNGAKLLQAAVMTVPDLAKDASALYQVSADDPPMLLMHGDQDASVPLAQSQRLAEALNAVGVPNHLEVIRGAGHGGKLFQEPSARDVVRKFLSEHLVK